MTTKQENDVVDVLLIQHDDIRTLIDTVKDAAGDRRHDAFQELVRLLVVHENAEEQVVHPIARRLVGEAVVDARLLEEEDVKTLLADLNKQSVEGCHFDEEFAALEAPFRQHAEREEQAEFPALRRTMDPARLRTMAHAVRAAEAVAPAQPHSQAGVHPMGSLVAGPPVALAGRARNAVERWRQSRRR